MKIFLITLLLTIPASALCQTPKKKYPKPPPPVFKEYSQKQYEYAMKCAFKRKYSDKALLKKIPFNLASEIQLVSFENLRKLNSIDSSLHMKAKSESLLEKYKFNDSTLVYDSVVFRTAPWIEQKVLDTTAIIKLANLIYNYGLNNYAPEGMAMISNDGKHGCYYPRNAILFYNKNKEVYSVIEFCFECSNIEKLPDDLFIEEACDYRIELFRQLFIKEGIKYGIGKND